VETLRTDDPSYVGPIRLLGRLGAGGMGRVYLGAGAAGALVAVKVVHAAFAGDPQFRRRFRSEVEALRQVAGGPVIAVVDADPEAAPPWLATEYVPGPSLAEAVENTGPLPPSSVPVLAGGLASALAHPRQRPGAPRRQTVERAARAGRTATNRLRHRAGGGRHPAHRSVGIGPAVHLISL
jgi:eukaryotic-like serine/threonine-protein kinase